MRESRFNNLLAALTIIILISAAAAGCNDGIELPEVTAEYPIVEVARPFFPGDSVSNDSVRVEMGYEFVPKVDGSFASITGVMPASGRYQVSLWEQLTQSTLGTWQVDFLRGIYQETFIEDKIELVAGQTYALTINTVYWYEYVPQDSLQVFPQTIGNIEVVRFGTRETFIPAYPNTFTTSAMNGLVDFRFEPVQSP